MKPEDVTDEHAEQVEEAVGVGSGAWDMLDPKEILAAAADSLADRIDERIRGLSLTPFQAARLAEIFEEVVPGHQLSTTTRECGAAEGGG